jgi:hypothetical protein
VPRRKSDVSAELFSQCFDDSFRPPDIAEQIDVLVLHHLSNQLGALRLQASKHLLNVIDGEHDATYTQRVHRCLRVSGGSRLNR